MSKKTETSSPETKNDVNRISRITEILAEGIYEYLKSNGFLKKRPDRTESINQLLERNRRILNSEDKTSISC